MDFSGLLKSKVVNIVFGTAHLRKLPFVFFSGEIVCLSEIMYTTNKWPYLVLVSSEICCKHFVIC